MIAGYLKNKIFFFFLFILCSDSVFSQNVAADTIRRQLAELKTDDPHYLEKKIGGLGTLFLSIVHTNPKEAMKVSDQLAVCLKLKGDSVKYYEALYRQKAMAYEQMGDYTNNILFLESYAEALNRIGKSDGYAYIDIGNAYYSLGLQELARGCYKQAEGIFEKENNFQGQCTVHNNYAQIFMARKQYDSALVELHITNSLRENKLKDPAIAGDSKLLIGICFYELHQYDSARNYFHRVLALLGSPVLQNHTDHVALQEEYSGIFNRLASVYINEKKWDSATYYLRTGFSFYQKAGYTRRINNCYATWGQYYLGREMPDSAFANISRYENRIKETGNPEALIRLYKLYADYYTIKQDKENYYKYMMLYYTLDDSLKGQSVNEGSLLASGTMMQLKNKSRIDQQNIILARQEKEKILLFAISGLLLFILSAGFFFFFQIRKKNKLIQHYNSELEEANLTKEKFLSVISHDLRNPFNTLIGMSNVLVNNVKEQKMAQVVTNAEAINESSRKAYVLLDNLMQWVSLQKEKITVRKENVNVTELVDEITLLFKNQALAQSITIQKDIRVSLIHSDKNLLQVILRNLLSNAIRHIPIGGIIKLRVEEKDGNAVITVEDNGNGIDEQTLKELFVKKDQTSIARKGGGLGLLLVREFVEQLDGTIQAENNSPSGARFTIVLSMASMKNNFQPVKQEENSTQFIFTEEEKKRMNSLITEIDKYEIFDTTELRACLENFDTAGSESLKEWIKNLSQSVYHANNEQFKKLISLAA
jgi:signal transduction histidine kinase